METALKKAACVTELLCDFLKALAPCSIHIAIILDNPRREKKMHKTKQAIIDCHTNKACHRLQDASENLNSAAGKREKPSFPWWAELEKRETVLGEQERFFPWTAGMGKRRVPFLTGQGRRRETFLSSESRTRMFLSSESRDGEEERSFL